MKQPLILLTNDDGIRAKGLRALVETAQPMGHLLVVAPEEGHSGQSHAITSKMPLRLRKVENFAEGVDAYACTGTPADCVKLAMSHMLSSKPDMILSGINHGSNSSSSVLYSGTVGAAQEGALYGIPSIALSLLNHADDADFSHCIAFGQKIIAQVMQKGLQRQICLNVNIPAIPSSEIKGMKFARQANGTWVEHYEKRIDPQGRDYFWLSGRFVNNEPQALDTDEWALNNGYISITPIHPDMTCYTELERMKTTYQLSKTTT